MPSAKRILVVEDDFLVAEKLRGMLEDEGHVIVGDTASGEEAVRLTSELRPDVVMLDLHLADSATPTDYSSELSGITAARQITAQCPTPIVALTAYETPELVAEASEAGLGYYLVKPADQRQVARAIEIAVARFDDLMELRRLNAKLQAEIAERKQAEAARRETETLLNSTGQMAKVGGWEVDAETLEVRWTEQTRRIHEVAADYEPPLEKALDFFAPQDQEKLTNAVQRALDVGEPYDMELRFITARERHRWVRTICRPQVVDGKTTKLVGTFQDITERKQTEIALRESEERYRSLFNSIRDAILVANTDREIINCNPAFTELFGYSLTEIRGQKTRHLYEYEEEFIELGKKLKEHAPRPNFFFTIHYRKKSGAVFAGETNIFYLRDKDGKVAGFIGLVRDITQRIQAQKKIASYAAELKRSNRELEQFAYVVSHDLQEPLRMVVGFLRLLEQQYQDQLDATGQEYIDYAMSGARRMQEMIRALLDLSRVERRGNPFVPTDCNALLERMLKDLSPTIEESGAEVIYDPLPTVMADAPQLAQVFQNLITNGIKFRREEEPPRVQISAKYLPPPTEQGQDQGAWLFSVTDNGIGIDPEQTGRIFQIFQRLHTEQEYPGLGIGLALCKRIIERHDGRIWVESEPGRGSTFYFALPAQTEGEV